MGYRPYDKQETHRDKLLNPANVMLSKVDWADNTFRITTCADLNKLVLSIQKLGLLHPPILKYNPPEYVIVSGFKRLAACKRLGWEKIPAIVLKENFGPFELAQLAIADNVLQRPLNLLETSRAVMLLTDVCTDQKQLKKTSQDLGLPFNPSVTAKLKKICRLPPKIQDGILADTINMSMALELGGLDPEVAEGLVELFDQLKIGLNKQRELLLLLKEIAKREDTSILQLIVEKTFNNILENTEFDRAVKRQKIRSYLRRRRFPSILQAEENYKKLVKQLKLGNNISLIPPKDFERMSYMMTLRFDNRKELSNLKEKLEEIIHHPSFDKILAR